jgi:hypothetical protein
MLKKCLLSCFLHRPVRRKMCPPGCCETGYAVLDPKGPRPCWAARRSELAALAPGWDALPPDNYLKDGGRYRRRRHSCFVVDQGQRDAGAAPCALAARGIQRLARRHAALV